MDLSNPLLTGPTEIPSPNFHSIERYLIVSSNLLQILHKLAVLKSELVDVWVPPQGVGHEVELKFKQQQNAGFVQKSNFLRDKTGKVRQKLVIFSVTEIIVM